MKTCTDFNFLTTEDDRTSRIVRKPGHNAIEKRYRSSINDRIIELKNIVAGEDTKLNKSAILRKGKQVARWCFLISLTSDFNFSAIDYIRYLQNKNTRLEVENKQLKAKLQTPRDGTQSSLVGSLSPPYSNPSHSPDPASYDEANLPGSPASLVESLASPGMLDKSRLALCMVMFTVVLFNPLAPLVSDSEGLYVTEGSSGRTILERKEEMMNMTTFLRVSTSSLLLSMLNVLFILAGKALSLRLTTR